MAKPRVLGTMEHVRTPAYRAHMDATIERGVCPLCQLDRSLNVVLRENRHWRVWKNPFAYKHHSHHLVIASVRHIDDVTKLNGEMWMQLGAIVRWCVRTFQLTGGGLVMRFGDSAVSGSTLQHLHMHVQVPDGTGPAFAVFCGKGFKIVVGD